MIFNSIRKNADNYSDKVAVIDRGKKITYYILWRDIRILGSWIDSNLEADAKIGIMLNNCYEAIVAIYAITLTNRVCVPLDTDLKTRNLNYIVNDTAMSLIIISQTNRDRLQKISPELKFLFIDSDNNESKNISVTGILKISQSLFIPNDNIEDTSTLAVILYTTGTTGPQKGVLLSHANLISATENINQFMKIGNWAIESLPMRISHSFGFARLRCVFAVGGTVIIENGFLRPEMVLKNMLKYRANAISSVPAGFTIILDYFLEQFKEISNNIQYIEIGSAPMQMKYKKRLIALCSKAKIFSHYGLTEASRSTFLNFHSDQNHLNTVGKASPNVLIKIIREDKSICNPGETGEIIVKGKMVTKGYWNKPDLTFNALNDGWLRTGDLGHVDDDGYLYLFGRKTEIINIGGLKVAPAEIEQIIKQFEGVKEVAAIGVNSKSDITSVIIRVYIIKSDKDLSKKQLEKYCIENLEAYKIPGEFVFVRDIPKTNSGKIKRQLLEELPLG